MALHIEWLDEENMIQTKVQSSTKLGGIPDCQSIKQGREAK